MSKKTGLVLTGGGARGAYQAGLLRGIAEIVPHHCFPFPIITGISAGSINAAFLACSNGSFKESAHKLWEIWQGLRAEDVFRQGTLNVASLAWNALLNSLLGASFKMKWPNSILDNTPLEKLLKHHIDPEAIKKRIKKGELLGVCFSATDFSSGIITSFFEAHSSVAPWTGRKRMGIEAELNSKHAMASSALPGIFKLVEINGYYYGDGSTRVDFPLVPAIKLGADRIIAMDMRFDKKISKKKAHPISHPPELGEIIASLLGSLFSDSLDQDLSRLALINEVVKNNSTTEQGWPKIPSMLFRPSQNPAVLAENIYQDLSPSLKKTLSLLGIKKDKNPDLISHLAFENVYIQKMLELGYKDALMQKDEFLNFIS